MLFRSIFEDSFEDEGRLGLGIDSLRPAVPEEPVKFRGEVHFLSLSRRGREYLLRRYFPSSIILPCFCMMSPAAFSISPRIWSIRPMALGSVGPLIMPIPGLI